MVVRFILIIIIGHKTDHSAVSYHSSGVEATLSSGMFCHVKW